MKKVLIALIATAFAAPAFAADNYVSASVGRAKHKLEADGTRLSERDTSFKAAVGHNFKPGLGVELGYVNFGETRLNADGTGMEIFAEGVRNTVGFTWHPNTKELWFTDNGRDMLGDNTPPDELNRAPKKGLHFGFPYCHAGETADPEFGKDRKCDEFVKPVQKLGPHVAALGLKFYTGDMFPEKFRNQILIAEHGSWNRSEPLGYRLMHVELDGRGNSIKYEPLAEGWLQNGKAWGRPVDVLVMPDGAILVSDDTNNAIYRITYSN